MSSLHSVSSLQLVKFYHDLIAQQQIKKDKGWEFKIKNYKKAVKAIEEYSSECTDMDSVKEAFKAAGMKNPKGLLEKAEMAFAGQSCRDEKVDAVETLSRIYGIGPEKAKKLFDMGIKTIDDLRKAYKKDSSLLTSAQKFGLKYYDDMFDKDGNERRIPRSEIEPFDQLLAKYLKDDYVIAGSYRRQKPDCGDIDVFTRRKCVQNLISKLESLGYDIDTLAIGPTKYMGFIRLTKDGLMRRLDIMYVPPEQYSFAINYFTGSKEHNVKMRANALKLGYTLNEHRIEHTDGSPVTASEIKAKIGKSQIIEERDLFDFLDMKWLPPHKR